MKELATLQPGTAWPLFLAVFVVAIAAVLIVALIPAKYRRISTKNLKMGEDGEIKVKKASLADEEIVRIALIIKNELGHDCIQRPVLGAMATAMDPLCQTVSALAERQIAQGANGLIKSGKERIDGALEEFRVVQAERMIG